MTRTKPVISRFYSLLRTFSSSSAFVNLLILKVNIRQYIVDKILIYLLKTTKV